MENTENLSPEQEPGYREFITEARVSYLKEAVPVLNTVADTIHASCLDAGWYTDLETGKPKERNLGEMISLMHSELSEALEGVRKNLMDDHLPHRSSEEVEIMDLIIRAFDYCGYRGLDFAALLEKFEYNQTRADHQVENRANGGKKF